LFVADHINQPTRINVEVSFCRIATPDLIFIQNQGAQLLFQAQASDILACIEKHEIVQDCSR